MRTTSLRDRSVHTLSALALCASLLASVSPASAQMVHEDLQFDPADGSYNDVFGWSVALGDGYMVVGTPQDDDNGEDSGSVYLFDAATGAFVRKLLPTDGQPGDNFGNTVAIDGGIVAVGAWHDDDNGADSGSAYLFDAATGQQLHKIVPADGNPIQYFAQCVAMDGGVVAIGAVYDDEGGSQAGAAYLYDAATGQFLHKLLATDGDAYHEFGNAIAIDAGRVVVGAVHDDPHGIWSGSAYVFDVATGVQLQKLIAKDGVQEDRFGHSVAIEGSTVVVGMEYADDRGFNSGAVYIFDANTGVQQRKLLANDGYDNDWFGHAVAIDGGVVAIGARLDDDNGLQSGSAYLYDAATGLHLVKLHPGDARQGAQFGNAIDIQDGVVGVGAVYAERAAPISGTAYLYGVLEDGCVADFNHDGFLDNGDIFTFLIEFLAGESATDVNGDGFLDHGDIGAFVEAFLAGC